YRWPSRRRHPGGAWGRTAAGRYRGGSRPIARGRRRDSMTRHDPVVVWPRRDLRLHHYRALSDAVASGRPVAPLFVFDPALLRGRFASPNRTWFLLATIVALRRELEARGSRLFVRVGDPSGVLPAFAREIRAREVVVSRDHTPYGRRRDRAVATALADAQIDLRAKRGLLIHEPESLVTGAGAGYTVLRPFLPRCHRASGPATGSSSLSCAAGRRAGCPTSCLHRTSCRPSRQMPARCLTLPGSASMVRQRRRHGSPTLASGRRVGDSRRGSTPVGPSTTTGHGIVLTTRTPRRTRRRTSGCAPSPRDTSPR